MLLAGIRDRGQVPGYGVSLLGVGFFAPFSATRYFFPWTPIEVWSVGFGSIFTDEGLQILGNEMLYVWLPFGVFWLLAALIRRNRRQPRKA